MTLISGKPNTQLLNLNILGQLRIQGILIAPGGGEDIVETSADYSQEVDDDTIYVTATATITMLAPASGIKSVTIRCIAGTTTISPTSGTVETTTLAAGQSIRLGPRSSGWFNL